MFSVLHNSVTTQYSQRFSLLLLVMWIEFEFTISFHIEAIFDFHVVRELEVFYYYLYLKGPLNESSL